MSDEKFKLPGSSYEELCRIIKSYGFLDKPFSLDDAVKVAKMNRTQISRNNGFLGAVGIIEGERVKKTATLGKKLAQALDFDRVDEIAAAWREIVWADEFLSKMLAAVKIRKGMDESTLQSHIAYSAGKQKTKEVMTGAQAIVEILQNADLLLEKDGQLIPTDLALGHDSQLEKTGETPIKKDTQADLILRTNKSLLFGAQTSSGIPIYIQIQINVEPSDLDDLAPKLRKLIEDISVSPDK